MNWETSYWSRCPGYISTWWGCYWYPFDLLQMVFLVPHKSILRIWIGCLIQKRIGDSHLHHGYPTAYGDREIDEMQFWPLPTECSYVSDNGRPKFHVWIENMPVKVLNPGEKRYVESFLQMESLTCWGIIRIISYTIEVATMTWKGLSSCFENDRIGNSLPWM